MFCKIVKGLPYGQLLIAKRTGIAEWEWPSQVLHVSADFVRFTTEPLEAATLDGFQIHSLPVPTTRDFI